MTQKSGPAPRPPQSGGYAPVPGYPDARQQGPYPPAPQRPAGLPAVRGTSAWAMGFLAYIPIPFFGQILVGVLMALRYRSLRGMGPLPEANARHAGNWGLTYAVATVLLIGTAVVCGVLSNVTAYQAVFSRVAVILMGIWGIGVNIVHVVLTIMGTVKANAGQVFANRVALPFIREPESVDAVGHGPMHQDRSMGS